MRRALPLSLAALALCGFGAGPFWGENKGPATGGAFEITNFAGCTNTTPGETSATCAYDAGTGAGRGLIVAICGVQQTADNPVKVDHPLTYNGVSMTQIAIPGWWGSSFRPWGALYYLNNPASGVNNIQTTFGVPNTTYSWAIRAARITGHAATQSIIKDEDNLSGGPMVNTINPADANTILYHFVCSMNTTQDALQSDNLTMQDVGTTGGISSDEDVKFGVATGPGTNTTNTQWTNSGSYMVGAMFRFQPAQ